jgi:hypothetical protein
MNEHKKSVSYYVLRHGTLVPSCAPERSEQVKSSPQYTDKSNNQNLFLLSTMTIFGPLSLSFAPYVKSSRTLSKWVTPIAQWYVNVSGYRKMGLRYDDLR